MSALCFGLLEYFTRGKVDVATAFEEEALLIGMELRVARRRLDLIASPQDTISADGMQERCVEGAEDVVLDADARRSLAVEGMSLGAQLGDDGMDADDGTGELIEARQYVLEEVVSNRDLPCLPRLVPHIVIRAEEDG